MPCPPGPTAPPRGGMGVHFWAGGGHLERVAKRRLGECNEQGLANTAWAFAMVDSVLPDELLLAALARAAEHAAPG